MAKAKRPEVINATSFDTTSPSNSAVPTARASRAAAMVGKRFTLAPGHALALTKSSGTSPNVLRMSQVREFR